MKRNPIYSVGDLIIDHEDTGLTNQNSAGLITKIEFHEQDDDYVYFINWSDLNIDFLIKETIITWRIENKIWQLYRVIYDDKEKEKNKKA